MPALRMPGAPAGSLRRRLLLIFMLLATVPGYLALVSLWLGVARAVQSSARHDAFTMSRNLGLELDRHISERSAVTRRVASDARIAAQLREWITPYLGAAMTVPPAQFETPLDLGQLALEGVDTFVIGPRGQLVARLTPRGILPVLERPADIDGLAALRRLSELPPQGAFALELFDPTSQGATLLLGAPLADPGREGIHYSLLARVPLDSVFRDTERLNPTLGQRLVVLSDRTGIIYASQRDSDFETALVRQRAAIFGAREQDDRLLEVLIRSVRHGIAAAELRSIQTLTSDRALPPVRWKVVQVVDLDEVLAGLRRQLWTAVLAGILLTVFAAVLAVWASGRVVEPVIRLTGGMRRFAMGDLDYRVHVKTGDELEVLANAANHMAASLLRSYQDLGERMLELDDKARQLELIHAISHSVNRVLDMDELFERLLTEIRDQVPVEVLAVGLVSDARDRVTYDYVHPPDALRRGAAVALHGSLSGECLHDQTLSLHPLLGTDGSYPEDAMLADTRMESLCLVPLIATNGAVGTLLLATRKADLFDPMALKLLERICESLALAVEHSRLYTRVARFAEELESTVEARTRELREAQAKLVQTEKFAATGSIASNIAHEINNPLSIIKNYIKILQGQYARREPSEMNPELMKKSIAIIDEEIDRIARIVSQLRMVSAPAKARVTRLALDAEIHKLVELLSGSLRKASIDLELDLDPALGEVVLCQDYLRQILINFLRNAMDAMEGEAGIITIRTVHDSPEPGLFTIEVSDTGCGIPSENFAKIFDPFFTTKVEGKGTGLGLSVSFGLARSMGGTIDVSSRLGQGTTMRLILPREVQEVASPEASVAESLPMEPERAADGPPLTGPAEETPVRRRGRKIIIG
jgi:signal transduction histidine kinase